MCDSVRRSRNSLELLFMASVSRLLEIMNE